MEKPMFINYRCRKCGQIFSRDIDIVKTELLRNFGQQYGLLVGEQYKHSNCNIEETEKTFCDMVSLSEKLLSESIGVMKEDKFYSREEYLKENEEESK